jgi:hypothetical protein
VQDQDLLLSRRIKVGSNRRNCICKKTLLVSLQVVGGSAWRFQVLGLNLLAVGFFFLERGGRGGGGKETGFYPLV